MSLIYIAVQRGIYRHDIVAACRTLEEAKVLGSDAIRAEPDHYHGVEIVSRRVGKGGPETVIGTLIPKTGPVTYENGRHSELLSIAWEEYAE
jgi:hypothetical protein